MISYCFRKEDKLLKPVDFKRVFDVKGVVKNKQLILFYAPNTLEHARIGFAVSKKCVRYAHQRNRIKRIAREWFREQKNQLPAVDIILLARHTTASCSNDVLFSSLGHLEKLLLKTQIKQNLENKSGGTLDG